MMFGTSDVDLKTSVISPSLCFRSRSPCVSRDRLHTGVEPPSLSATTPPMTTPAARQDTYQGLGDGFSRAFEVALTPAIVGGIGFLIDRWLGTMPWFTVGFTVFGVVGTFLRFWYTYDAEMSVHQAAAIESRSEARRTETARLEAERLETERLATERQHQGDEQAA